MKFWGVILWNACLSILFMELTSYVCIHVLALDGSFSTTLLQWEVPESGVTTIWVLLSKYAMSAIQFWWQTRSDPIVKIANDFCSPRYRHLIYLQSVMWLLLIAQMPSASCGSCAPPSACLHWLSCTTAPGCSVTRAIWTLHNSNVKVNLPHKFPQLSVSSLWP